VWHLFQRRQRDSALRRSHGRCSHAPRRWRAPEPLESRCLLTNGPLLISEICANNDTGLVDDLGYRSDWIEIHNPTSSPVNLDSWYLSHDPARLTEWQFPAVTIGARAYLVVFATGLNHQDPARALHTSFKLSSEGDYLALVQPDGRTISSDCAPQYRSSTRTCPLARCKWADSGFGSTSPRHPRRAVQTAGLWWGRSSGQ